MKTSNKILIVVLINLLVFVLAEPVMVFAATAPSLGVASSFAVLAGSGITSTNPPQVIVGDAGSNPTVSNGLTGAEVTGTNYTAADAAVIAAKVAAGLAYADASTQPQSGADIATDLAAQNLTPGVYHSAAGTFAISGAGTLTLNGGGDPNAVFIFKADTTLITGGASSVVLTNGAQARNVFWTVGTSATLDNTTFVGTIMAEASITDSGNSTINGRLLADAENNGTGAVTLNNTDVSVPTVLHLRKTMTNDNGGTALNTAWTLTATGASGSPTNLTGTTPVNSGTTFKADTYTLAESGGPSGYTASTYSCVTNGGGAVVSNTITLATGDDATCTINNNDNAAHLIVIKHVVNDNSGSAVASAFSTTISGVTTAVPTAAGAEAPGVDNTLTSVGAYSVDEGAHVGYDKTLSSGCSGTIAIGETKTCTITNDDIDPATAILYVVKEVVNDDSGTATVSDFDLSVKLAGVNVTGSPAVGVASPGRSYTLSPGTYTVSEVADVSYTQSFSGDCDSSGSMTLVGGNAYTCTITNDDITQTEDDPEEDESSNSDIKVTKKASPSALPSGPGSVTYTYKVTNEGHSGDASLRSVSVKDDKCSPVKYISGDKDHDSRLDTDEEWKYSCTRTVSQTETNRVVARARVNGEDVSDSDTVRVVVSVPGFPNAGAGLSDESHTLWSILMPVQAFFIALFF